MVIKMSEKSCWYDHCLAEGKEMSTQEKDKTEMSEGEFQKLIGAIFPEKIEHGMYIKTQLDEMLDVIKHRIDSVVELACTEFDNIGALWDKLEKEGKTKGLKDDSLRFHVMMGIYEYRKVWRKKWFGDKK